MWPLTVLTRWPHYRGFLMRNVWSFCRGKNIGRNNEVARGRIKEVAARRGHRNRVSLGCSFSYTLGRPDLFFYR